MKRFNPYILFFCISLLTGIQVSAQCEPDTSCTDFNESGVFCPAALPVAILSEPYEAVLTVIPPSEFEFQVNFNQFCQ